VGLAFLFNGLSAGHRDYLAAGGVGFIIGDGALRYGAEEILELFYNLQLKKGINVTFDFQDRKSTRLNSIHGSISYAVLFLKKKNDDVAFKRMVKLLFGIDNRSAESLWRPCAHLLPLAEIGDAGSEATSAPVWVTDTEYSR